jgi:hypothetical protein
MPDNPLKSLTHYSRYITKLLNRPTVEHSTLSVWSDSPYTGVAEGDVFFTNGLRPRVREDLDFLEGIIPHYISFVKKINLDINNPKPLTQIDISISMRNNLPGTVPWHRSLYRAPRRGVPKKALRAIS